MSEAPAASFWTGRRAEGVLAALALLVFAGALDGAFLGFDDDVYVTANARVQDFSLAGLLHVLSPGDAWAGRFYEYYPLRDAAYWLLFSLVGATAWVFHLASLLLHVACTVLVRRLIVALSVDAWAAWLGAAWFAVHPTHVESIAWIASLKDPLFTLFVLLALLRHLASTAARPDAGVGLAFVGALASKGVALAFAPLAVVCDVVVPPARTLAATARRTWPWLLLAAVATAHILYVGRQNDVLREHPGGSFFTGALTSVWSALLFVSKVLAPTGLNARYLVEPVLTPLDPRFLAAAAVLLALTAVTVVAWRRGVWQPLFAWAFYLTALLPVLAPVPRPIEVADRFQYLASVGVAFAFASGVCWLGYRARRRLAVVVAALALLPLIAGTLLRVPVFHDDLALWRDVADQPGAMEHPFVLNNLGRALVRDGRVDEGLALYERAVEVAEPDDRTAAPAHANLAIHLAKKGRLTKARHHAQRAAELEPRNVGVQRTRLMIAQREEDWPAAVGVARALVDLEPRVPMHRLQLGAMRLFAGDDGGLEDLASAVQADRGLCAALGSLAAELAGRDHPDAPAVRSLCDG